MSLDLRDRIRDVPDFPTAGVVFKDLMPLIADPEYFAESIRQLAEWARPRSPDLVLGAEARGFIFGGALAFALGAGFVAARKPGKLPRETIEASYSLEDARRNFRRHWTMYDVEHPESWVAPPTAEEIALKRELIELYEALRAEPDEWTSLTDRLRKAERELDRLVLRRAGA